MKVAKWGNSLAVRLPASVVEALQLREGDEVRIESSGNGVLRVERVPGTDELWERLNALRSRLPTDFKFNREEANER